MSGKGQMFVEVERHEEKREENVTPFASFHIQNYSFLREM